MNEAKHTPGPWTAHEVGVLSSGEPLYEITSSQQKRGPVAEYVFEADAHLIAAAPELLEACKEMLLQFGVRGGNGASEQARAAIAKATGATA